MNLKIISCLILFCPFLLKGQNLIPNPSFEDTIAGSFGFKLPKSWSYPTNSRPEFFTSFHNQARPDWGVPQNLIGNQEAKEGNSYLGLRMYPLDTLSTTDIDRRDYIQAKLQKQLQKDSIYCLQLFVTLADSAQFSSRAQLGIYLSTDKIDTNTELRLPYSPQIMISPITYIKEKEKWVEYNIEFTADSNEQYLLIGNFNSSSDLDTSFVGGGNEFWHETTYYFIDNIYLGHCDSVPNDTLVSIAEKKYSSSFKGYPNPTQNEFYVESRLEEALEFQWFNAVGQNIVVPFQTRSTTASVYAFSLGDLPKGIYLLNVISKTERATLKVVKE